MASGRTFAIRPSLATLSGKQRCCLVLLVCGVVGSPGLYDSGQGLREHERVGDECKGRYECCKEARQEEGPAHAFTACGRKGSSTHCCLQTIIATRHAITLHGVALCTFE